MAGYYVYLPATFIYDFDASAFPDSMDYKTGGGFDLIDSTHKVSTKYTYGVAILEMPFFLLAHTLAPIFGQAQDGFAPIYHKMINVSGVFYLSLGLGFLFMILYQRHSMRVAVITLAALLLGTNLYYYGISETGMSHVYSFALFSAFLYLIIKNLDAHGDFKKLPLTTIATLGLLAGLIILIRPTNLIFLSSLVFLYSESFSKVADRLGLLFSYKVILPILLMVAIVMIPQSIYWNYLHGTGIKYSYGDEGFNWSSPKLLYTWFSTDNGLFVYTPLYFYIVYTMLRGMRFKVWNAGFQFAIFILISYVFSCWWKWDFGCAFGARSYVEYSALFALTVSRSLAALASLRPWKRKLVYTFISLCILLNLKMTYNFDVCYYGEGNWDWDWLRNLIFR